LEVLLPLAAPLLVPGGELWALKGPRLDEERAALREQALAPFDPEPRLHAYRIDAPHLGGTVAVYRRRAE